MQGSIKYYDYHMEYNKKTSKKTGYIDIIAKHYTFFKGNYTYCVLQVL